MEKQKVYIETTIVSYLTGKPSRNLIIAAKQEITRSWWENEKENYELFVSEFVMKEAVLGDISASDLRMQKLQNIPLIVTEDKVLELGKAILEAGLIPQTYSDDAMHISVASVNGIDYLLTWNCKHIANANIKKKLMKLITGMGYAMPIICTPDELIKE